MPLSPSTRLFLLSFLVLFFELAIIRWTAANIFYVGYFTNFVLLACLLGIGLGCLGGHWKIQCFRFFPYGLTLFVALVLFVQVDVFIQAESEIHFQASSQGPILLPIWVVLPALFVGVSALFLCLAQPMSALFRSLPPLRAYTYNICGSLAGIAAYTGAAFARMPPLAWFSISLVLFFLMNTERGKWRLYQALTSIACLAFLSLDLIGEVYWSPYYKVKLHPYNFEGNLVGTHISVNGVGHQNMVNPGLMETMYHLPYLVFGKDHGFKDALIIGAGSGSDVALGLARGLDHIDAVDIDPVIVELGRELHPSEPYGDPRVSVYINDGRAFLQSTSKKYDLIVFGLPDSLTLVSAYSSLRLENFLFTLECFQSARDHLKENGLFVLYNYYREPWYVQKLAKMLQEIFQQRPYVHVWKDVVDLPGVLMIGPRLKEIPEEALPPQPYPRDPSLKSATDDWPFTYLRGPAIPKQYFMMFGLLAPFCVVAVRLARGKSGDQPLFWNPFFFMGAGFFLLEAKSLVQFSLLFGSTWLVNSLVFFAILLAVLLANLIVARVRFERLWPLGAGLAICLALNYFLPPDQLLIRNWVLRYLAASAVIFSPIFFANLLFSRFFQSARAADIGFASNLLGALAGGMLEYASLLVGYRHLTLAVGVLYVLVFLTVRFRMLEGGAESTANSIPKYERRERQG